MWSPGAICSRDPVARRMTRDFLCPRALPLDSTRATEDVREAVISLVAGVLEKRTVEPPERDFPGPGTRPRRGIVHRELVTDSVVIDAREPLDHVQGVARE